MTNEVSAIMKQMEQVNDYLYGAPIAVILGLFSIAFGYFLRTQTWFPNRFIPLAIFAIGLIGNPLMNMGRYNHAAALTPQILTHVMIGAVASFGAWQLHNKVLKRIEDKIPFIGKLLADETPATPPPVDTMKPGGQ